MDNSDHPFSDKHRVRLLEHLSAIADAKLGVAEELRWVIAALFASLMYQWSHNWFYTVAAWVVSWILTAFTYRRESEKAEDEYYRAAGAGKYLKPRVEAANDDS